MDAFEGFEMVLVGNLGFAYTLFPYVLAPFGT
jgi:hypothetical protein